MAPWPDTFMMGTDLYTDFNTLNDIFDTADAVDPDAPPPFYAGSTDNVDGSKSWVGFPTFTWKRSGWTDEQIEILQQEFWQDAPSVELYVRTLTNRLDNEGNRLFRTYLTQAIWPTNEDKQAGYTVDFTIEFRHCILQDEAE